MSATVTPPICPYCGQPSKAVDGRVTYPHRPDIASKMFWLCAPCQAWVGCHPGSMQPLGRLANAELRKAKSSVHAIFDPLWRAKMKRDGCSKNEARSAGYKWLADQLGIEGVNCHVGMFDIETCERAVAVCRSSKGAKHDG